MSQARSLYIHFPFCEAKCHYCDFYSLGREKTKATDALHFETALKGELKLKLDQLDITQPLETVFLGGGTPSMTAPESMKRSLALLWDHHLIDPEHTEWTMEANPSSVNTENLAAYRSLGINRISLGVQSLEKHHLKNLGRVHSPEAVANALTAIFNAGFKNVSVDLLCGVPGQSLEELKRAIHALNTFPITHLSCYLLTLSSHHPMASQLPKEDTQLEHLLFIHDQLTGFGFEHYEISNFCKPGFKAQHNLNYWTGKSYLGLGPSAHSYQSHLKIRSKNVSSLNRYVNQLKNGETPTEWTETLTPEQLRLESWMLALRLSDGFPKTWMTSQKQTFMAQKLVTEGLLETHPENTNHYRLTSRGFPLSDQIISSLAHL